MIIFTLSYQGNEAEDHQLDFYDVAQGLIGFQRSLALTSHLVLNGEVITKAPFLKNATIHAYPPEEGSWKIVAGIAVTSYYLTTAPMDTPLGHLMHSAYDYVISETMGFHVDYEQTLQQQYKTLKQRDEKNIPILEQSQFDSVIEKCEYSIQEMHRPIVKSETAEQAQIFYNLNGEDIPFEAPLTVSSYEYIRHTHQSDRPETVQGKVSSYNINTFKGRIFIPDEGRPISFTLSDGAKTPANINKIMNNMTMNARERFGSEVNSGLLSLEVLKNSSRSGRLKSYYVLEVN